MPKSNLLIYILRRDLRIRDNPILHHLANTADHGFTHLLPVFVFPAHQMEVSGLLREGRTNPYPPAKSPVGGHWRCGPHRAKFIGESVWDLKSSMENLESGLALRAGMINDVLDDLFKDLTASAHNVGAVWMTGDEGVEERRDEKAVDVICKKHGAEFKLWIDEKYFIDDRDLNIPNMQDLPDIFTTYRKSTEPLREKPRAVLTKPPRASLPPYPDMASTSVTTSPFVIPDDRDKLLASLLSPVKDFLPDLPPFPQEATSAHPFTGGEGPVQHRVHHLVKSGVMKNYNQTRNGLTGTEFSTKLSAYLALGCISARQIHHSLLSYEDGTNKDFEGSPGFGEGENDGTKSMRFELLWRDYMRLCTKKFKHKLFRLEGFRVEADYNEKDKRPKWKTANQGNASQDQDPDPTSISSILERFYRGTTGMGLIDASQRELLHTGYTSNRARQNSASFLAKHLGIDWRYGAEWYEMLLVDYDMSSNWANWQYVSGVGNDPRGEARIFNPVKQAFDYDKEGKYVRAWVPEVAKLDKLENVFQAWTTAEDDLKAADLHDNIMVTNPVKRIEFSVEGKPKTSRRSFARRRSNAHKNGDTSNGDSESPEGNGAEPPAPGSFQQSYRPYRGRDGYRRGFRGNRGGGGAGGAPAAAGGGAGGMFRGNRGYSTPRGGYRGRFAPPTGRGMWRVSGVPNPVDA